MSTNDLRRRAAILVAAVGCVAGLSALILADAVSATASSGGVSPPAAVTASLIRRTPGTARPGKVIPSNFLGERAFPNARHGFALATYGGVTYPASTADGGATWRIDGPALHLPAAQAPLVVLLSGAAGSRTQFAWGGPDGGQVVDVTSDGGRHWYQAILGDLVLSVLYADGRLIAVSQSLASATSSAAVTTVYVSHDGGRHWRLDSNLGAR